ncbi:hypothetical protein [Terrabacter sp. Ter38]|uniref:hypothetical protein n=1 Tax=Terrabacter sp. Ter38 TaxID=2926030 RepID=UPI0021190CA8|nr:hypothetical protein [Terrabacter sp. Ter38]
MQLPDEIRALSDTQLGVLSRTQLLEAGVPAGLIRWQSARHWRSLLPGVLMLNTGQPTDRQRLVAAQLYAGPAAWMRGDTALACLGSRSVVGAPVKLYVPYPQRSRRVMWVSIAATKLTNERTIERDGVRMSCRARAIVDAAADAVDDRTARAIIVGSVQERFVRLSDVQHWVGVRRRNGTVRLKAALAEAAAGAWSLPEAELADILRHSPQTAGMWANPELKDGGGNRLTTPDLWADDVGLAVMVHSRRFHSGVLDWDATVLADQDLRDAGVEVVPVTPSLISSRPRAALEAVLAGLERARRRPRPDVVATPLDTAWAA